MTRSDEIAENLATVSRRVEEACLTAGRARAEVTLIAVTKNFPVEDVRILYELGVRDFGENRDSEGAQKSQLIQSDAIWHFQGQIQSNKITSIMRWANCVHSLGSLDHAKKFDSLQNGAAHQLEKIFVQLNFEPERRDRGGVPFSQIEPFLEELTAQTALLPNGLMTVAPLDRHPARIFEDLCAIRARLITSFPTLIDLSMGMSGDYEAAIVAGATHVRIGSSILGSRGVPA